MFSKPKPKSGVQKRKAEREQDESTAKLKLIKSY